jgi:hypothetical protein
MQKHPCVHVSNRCHCDVTAQQSVLLDVGLEAMDDPLGRTLEPFRGV